MVIAKDGRRFAKHIDYPHRHQNDPLTDAEVEVKFNRSVRLCGGSAQIQSIIDFLWNVDKLEKVEDLAKPMVWE